MTQPLYQTRVLTEKADLDCKIAKLQAFMDSPKALELISPSEEDRLTSQLDAMLQYSACLAARVAAW